mgnify:CR=1 FL=1
MKASNLFNADDRAVSPVIGVILMVAITVILAAVIGTFVLGLGDQIGGSATAGVTIDGEGTGNATVTLTNSGTAQSVQIRNATDGNPITNGNLTAVGSSVSVDTNGNYTVVAIGSDGSESVLRSFEV